MSLEYLDDCYILFINNTTYELPLGVSPEFGGLDDKGQYYISYKCNNTKKRILVSEKEYTEIYKQYIS
jgi:hypothetical protein